MIHTLWFIFYSKNFQIKNFLLIISFFRTLLRSTFSLFGFRFFMQHLSLILLHACFTRIWPNGLSSENMVKYEQAKHRRGLTIILHADIIDKHTMKIIINCILCDFKVLIMIFYQTFNQQVFYTDLLPLMAAIGTYGHLAIFVTTQEGSRTPYVTLSFSWFHEKYSHAHVILYNCKS